MKTPSTLTSLKAISYTNTDETPNTNKISRPQLTSRKSSGTIIIPREAPTKAPPMGFLPDDARAMNPRRSSKETDPVLSSCLGSRAVPSLFLARPLPKPRHKKWPPRPTDLFTTGGSSISYSEQNEHASETVHFLQIWALPWKSGLTPGYHDLTVEEDKKRQGRIFAIHAPLGLSAFALTTFVLGLINMRTRTTAEPNLLIGLAFGYGGLAPSEVTELDASKARGRPSARVVEITMVVISSSVIVVALGSIFIYYYTRWLEKPLSWNGLGHRAEKDLGEVN
ncbi:MAG: hypothetical protein Q9221_004946 [Calogaya cf. arnoldii]